MTSGQCVVVVSHPRSGTHFTIDFLRRNFEGLHYAPPPWASAESLYFNLDRSAPRRQHLSAWSHQALERPSFIVKTHDLPFVPELMAEVERLAAGREVVCLYPFRRLSKTLVSFRNFSAPDIGMRAFLDMPDTYFEAAASVTEACRRHGNWALDHAVPLDIEAGIKAPEALAEALEARFGWQRRRQASLLPPKRPAPGKLGEVLERLRGRQSSEVRVVTAPGPKEEAGWIDEVPAMKGLYERLKEKALV